MFESEAVVMGTGRCRVISRIRRNAIARRYRRRLLVLFYAVPRLAAYLFIDSLKRKVYALEVKRGRAFGYRVYRGRSV